MSDFNSSLPVRTQSNGDVVANIADGTTPSQLLAVTAAGEAKVTVTEPLPAGSNLIGQVNIDVGGSLVSPTNPVPVSIVDTLAGLSYINDYNTTAALASGSSSNHDYSITSGKTFRGSMFWGTASGKLKIEVQISPDGSTFTSKWVGFNSTATPNIAIQLDTLSIAETGTGAKIRIIRTNEDKVAMDVYSTISGTEQ